MLIDRILSPQETHRATTGLAGRMENACLPARVPPYAASTGYLKNMIEAIANSKVRRMERELELRGIRFDRSNNNWVVRNPRSNQRSRGLIRAIPRPQSGFNSSRGVSHAPAFIHRIRSRFPSAQR